jgi:hypothetical protein
MIGRAMGGRTSRDRCDSLRDVGDGLMSAGYNDGEQGDLLNKRLEAIRTIAILRDGWIALVADDPSKMLFILVCSQCISTVYAANNLKYPLSLPNQPLKQLISSPPHLIQPHL